jgi:hypothetical protein
MTVGKFFEFEDRETELLFKELVHSTDKSEPCYDPHLEDKAHHLYESPTDIWVEPWNTRRAVSIEQAEALCEGCHVYELCREYAIANNEPQGIWGGTTPQIRKVIRKGREL